MPVAQAGGVGEVEQQTHRVIREAVFRIVEIDPLRVAHQARAAPGIFRKQIPHMHGLDRLVMLTKGIPGSALREWNCTARHRITSLAFQRFPMWSLLPDAVAALALRTEPARSIA